MGWEEGGRLAEGETEASGTHWRKKNTEEGAKKRKGPRDGERQGKEMRDRERFFWSVQNLEIPPRASLGKVSEWGMKENGRKWRKGKRNHNVATQNGRVSCHQHPKRGSGKRGP